MRCSRGPGVRAWLDSEAAVAIVGAAAILLNGGAGTLALLFGTVLP
jgi:hypothetical protein